MLTNLNIVRSIPGLPASLTDIYLQGLVVQADAAVKSWTKQNIEQKDYIEFYSGQNQPDIVLRQFPVQQTTLEVRFDMAGYYGQASGSFPSSTVLTLGGNYALILDSGGVNSNRGILRRISGSGTALLGAFWPEMNFATPGKLSAMRLPVWPRGEGNIRVAYRAGYANVPDDVIYATASLVMMMARMQRYGGTLYPSSESGPDYSISYSLLAFNQSPEIGTIRSVLGKYRDAIW